MPSLRREDPDVATRRDRLCSGGAAGLYSFGLAAAGVALPLRALEVGYSFSEVGLLTALTAVSQILSRIGMGSWMRRLPDWTFVAASTVLLAASCALAAYTTALVPFALAHLLQGSSRAFFWTGSQTHVVRGERSAVRALASMNFVASIGQLVGPVVAGAVGSHSLNLSLVIAGGVSLLGLVPAVLLDRLPVFTRPTGSPPGLIWRRPGVDAGCWAGVSAGAWRGLLSSYVPIALTEARQSSTTIGALVSVANVAQTVGQAGVGRLQKRAFAATFAAGVVASAVGIGLVGVLAPHVAAAGAALALSGLGAGALQTLGPALASDAVSAQERGQAIAAAGTFRAVALFVMPLGTSAMVAAVPVVGALACGALVMLWPAVYTRRLARHLSS